MREEKEPMEDYSESKDFEEHQQHIRVMNDALGTVEIPANARVLDVGGGQGMHACFLAAQYELCWCSDILDYQTLYNGEYYRLFFEKCSRNSVHYERDSLRFIECDAMDMLFRDDYFDFVTSFNAFEHIPDPGKALDEILRVTKPGGVIYITFDPIWTADTGSHFIHRVKEPWAHLVLDQQEFIDRMLSAGASEDEVSDFTYGMNQRRLSEYRKIFDDTCSKKNLKLLHRSSWSGLVERSHRKHENYKKCIQLGYSEEELNLRGMCFVFRKC